MVFPVIGGDGKPTGYEIDNSLRFNDGDSPTVTREFGADPDGDRKTFTISFWAKRSTLSSAQATISAATTNNFYDQIIFASDDGFEVNNVSSASDAIQYKTSAKLRDVSAWYHLVVAMDTTQASASNGIKIYINGVLQTSFATSTYNQNATFEIGRNGTTTSIGRGQRDSDKYFDGYLSEVYFIAGAQKAASDFGETNDNGVWIPKKYTGTYGTNGFKLEFKQTGTSQNSSGIGADTSGNDQHFAVSNLAATDVTTDTPTNNFCTFSSIDVNVGQVPTFEEGNTKFTVASGNNHSRTDATIRPSSGKWYAEFTFLSGYSTADGTTQVGIISGNAGRYASNNDSYDQDNGNDSEAIGYRANGSVVNNSGTQILDGLTTFTTDDIMGIALDLDNDKFFVSKNGTFFTNGTGTQDPPNGTNPLFSGGVITSHKIYGFNIGAKGYGSTQNVIAANFGNPHTSISSGNADANGYGNFEYAVPSGYYSLCTKNLAEYG